MVVAAIILGIGFLGDIAQGQISVAITSADAPTGTPTAPHYLIDSDATNPAAGYDRDTLPGSVTASFTLSGFSGSGNYQAVGSLIDENGVAVALATGGTTLTSSIQAVSMNALNPNTTRTFFLNLKPANSLAAGKEFRLRYIIERVIGSNEFPETGPTDSSAFTLVHFDDSPENPAARYARGYLRSDGAWTKLHARRGSGIQAQRRFNIQVPYTLARYDLGGSNQSIIRRFTVEIQDDLGNAIPLLSGGVVNITANLSANFGGTPLVPAIQNFTATLPFEPLVQLDSANRQYYFRITYDHQEITSPSTYYANGNTPFSAAAQLLHFNGNLRYGSGPNAIQAVFTSITNTPAPGATGINLINTTLGASGGSIPGHPGFSWSTPSPHNVQLLSNGDAIVTNGLVTLVPSDPSLLERDIRSIRVSYASIRLDQGGASVPMVTVHLPQGLSHTGSKAFSRGRYQPFIIIESGLISLDTSLTHIGDIGRGLGTDAWVFDEARTIDYRATEVALTQNGELNFALAAAEWTHTPAYNSLENNQLAGLHKTPDMAIRQSNEGYLRDLEVRVGDPLTFIAGTDGAAQLVTAELTINRCEFQTHFPAGAVVRANSGALNIYDGAVSPTSFLDEVDPMVIAYDASCPGDLCGPDDASIDVVVRPNADRLTITPTGGLFAEANLDEFPLEWGIRDKFVATHKAGTFLSGFFLASGNHLPAAANPFLAGGPYASRAEAHGVSALALAGYDPATTTTVQPNTPAYRNGVGAYAGVTVQVDAPRQGASRLADMIADYPYTLIPGASKYYVRRSGVTGRQVAQDNTFAANVALYGYPFEFTSFQLSFISSVPAESWINGQVAVPSPSDFDLEFDGLEISCTGALERATLKDAGSTEKTLEYWITRFTPHSIQFSPNDESDCYSTRTLAVGLTTQIARLPTPVSGVLGFKPNGNIATLADGVANIDGRLGLPASIVVDGPEGEFYRLNPVTKLYFNNAFEDGGHGAGWASFAATCDIPFFEDLKIHVTLAPTSGFPATLYFSGGWKEGTAPNERTFFNDRDFDPTHRSFPNVPGMSYNAYRDPQSKGDYAIVARQSIFGLIDLAYPLRWYSGARYFESWEPESADILVLEAKHSVDYLSADKVELSFGAKFDGIGKLNLVSAAYDVADKKIGAAKAITDAARGFVTDSLDEGMKKMGELVEDTAEKLFEPTIKQIEDDIFSDLVTAIGVSYSNNLNQPFNTWILDGGDLDQEIKALFNSEVPGIPSARNRLKELKEVSTSGLDLIGRINDTLEKIVITLDSVAGKVEIEDGKPKFNKVMPTGAVISVTQPATNGSIIPGILVKVPVDGGGEERQIMQRLVKELIDKLAPEDIAVVFLNTLAAEVNLELNKLLVSQDSAIDRLIENHVEARKILIRIIDELAEGQKIAEQIKKAVESAEAEIDGITDAAAEATRQFIIQAAAAANVPYFATLGQAPNFINELNEEAMFAAVRRELRDALLSSKLGKEVKKLMRQHISQLDQFIRTQIDSMFAEVTKMARSLIKKALGPIDDAVNELLGEVGKKIGAGSIEGYAHIQGDTIRKLRLDAEVAMKLPDEIKLKAYFEMLCYDSSTDTGGCALPPGVTAVEVKIGALEVPIGWIAEDLRADLGVWFSMQTAPTVRPTGLGGSFKVIGDIDFEGVVIKGFGAALAIGTQEAYIACAARLEVSSYEAAGGIFFGRACRIEPLLVVDPEAASVLGNPPFTGAYVYGELWLPVSEVLLGIPATCMFRISAGVGAGVFFFVEGPTFGGKILLGLSGEALCLVSIRGEVVLIGLMSGGDLRFTGRGTLTGKAGYCPLCLKFSETARITYQQGAWTVDF